MSQRIRLSEGQLRRVIRSVIKEGPTDGLPPEEVNAATSEAMLLMRDYPEVGPDDIVDYLLSSGFSASAAEEAANKATSGRSGNGGMR